LPHALFVGDSVTTGGYGGEEIAYPDDVCARKGWQRVGQAPYIAGTNAAIPGSTLQDYSGSFYPAVDTFAERGATLDVQFLFIQIGTNDWGSDRAMTLDTWGSALANLLTQVNQMASHPHVYVIGLQTIFFTDYTDPLVLDGTGVPSATHWWSSIAGNQAEAQVLLDGRTAAVAKMFGATFIPLMPGMDLATMFNHNSNGTINLHPNTLGNRYITDRVMGVVGVQNRLPPAR